MKLFTEVKKRYEADNELMRVNHKAAQDYLYKLFLYLSVSVSLLMLVLAIPQCIEPLTRKYGVFYFIGFFSTVLVAVVFLFTKMKSHIIVGIYLTASLYMIYGIFLSIVCFPGERATTMIALLCFILFCLLDKLWRVLTFEFVFLVLHIVLSYIYKSPWLFYVDLINCFSFGILGLLFALLQRNIRLKAFEAQRLLNIEKTTDALMKIKNRRMMNEELVRIQKDITCAPAGILMLDIDYFKRYNDTYGHAAGDKCLELIGELLNDIEKTHNINTFRYGGEECVVFVYEPVQEEIVNLAREILVAISELETGFGKITASIGIVICDDASITNYETWIDYADQAMYRAKKSGRNTTVLYQP